jgi:catechol 2,3-dioxygenase-like lactoylglutathione lyase family enzyme
MASPLRVAHVTVVVTSLDLSMRYYAALLPLIGFMEESYGIWSDGAGFHLKFLEAAAGGPSTRSNAVGIAHLGFSAPAPEFLDEIRDAMAAAGFSGAEVQSLNGCISLFLEDPDGIRIEIIHHRAGPDAGTDPGARPGKTDASRGLPHPPGLY